EAHSLAGRHADCAVEADGLAVQHRVLDDVDREAAIFGGVTEPRGMRHLRAEALARFLVETHQQRREEQAGRDGVDADLLAGEIARRRQGQADHAALRGRIGDLADLAFIGCDARRVDDDAALLADRLGRDAALREQAQAVERADQIDIDDAREFRQRIDAVAADDALRAAYAGAIHQDARDAMRAFRFRDRGLDRFLVGDVRMQGYALHLGCDLLGIFLALVDYADLCALGGHGAGGRGAEARTTAGDEYGNVFQLHFRVSPCVLVSLVANSEWRVANREGGNRSLPFAIRHSLFASLFAIRYSLFALLSIPLQTIASMCLM